MKVGVLAPWAATNNLGDYVIGDACVSALWDHGIAVSEAYPTHIRPPLRHLRRAVRRQHLVLAGTNALDARMESNLRFWVTPDLAACYRHKVILMGVGWGTYNTRITKYSRWVIEQLLDPEALHSVRDSFTGRVLSALGYRVEVTGCPSTWGLHLPGPDPERPSRAIATFTHSNRPDPRRDSQWLAELADLFDEWSVQPMEFSDVAYALELGVPASRILPVSLQSFNHHLSTSPVTVVGTRLHAGIRALQFGRQAVIIAIDNRAREMAADFRLPVVEPDAGISVQRWLDEDRAPGPILDEGQEAAVERFLAALAAAC